MTATANIGMEKVDDDASQAGITTNEALDVIDAALALKLVTLTDANYTLGVSGIPAEWQYGGFKFSGPLTAGRNVVVPLNKKQYTIVNTTGQTLTVKTAAGTGIAVATAKAAIVACDGTNVIRITPDTTP
jgi:hypothetical protein